MGIEIKGEYRVEPIEKADDCEGIEGANRLKRFSQEYDIEVPKEYTRLVKGTRGLEINIGCKVYVRIWDESWCVQMNEAYTIQEYVEGGLAIGDNEGGDCLIYLNGREGRGLYLMDYGNQGEEDAVYISKSLKGFLQKGEGVERVLERG